MIAAFFIHTRKLSSAHGSVCWSTNTQSFGTLHNYNFQGHILIVIKTKQPQSECSSMCLLDQDGNNLNVWWNKVFVLCYFSFLHFFIDTCKYIYLYVSVFFSLFIRLTLEKTTLFFTKIHFYFYCEFKKYALCVANELFVLATLLHSTEETFSPAFVIRILLNFPKKQDHCFAPLKKN